LSLISDGLLIAAALTAAIYCHVLARRLRRFADLDSGIGEKIAGLDSALADTRDALAETQRRLGEVKSESKSAGDRLRREIARAERLGEDLDAMAHRVEGRLRRLYESEHALGLADTDGVEIVSDPEPIDEPDPGDMENIERSPARAHSERVVARATDGLRLPKIGRLGL